jgi:hypothetical protein
MRGENSLDALNGENKKSGRTGLLILVIAIAHALFYFAPSFYLPFDLGELFVLGYLLIIADSGLLVFLGIKLLGPALHKNKIARR